MLLKDPIYYYSRIREHYKNSYLAEDTLQVIIGIDCEYVDSYEHNYKSLEQLMRLKNHNLNFLHFYLLMRRLTCIIRRLARNIHFMGIKKNIIRF